MKTTILLCALLSAASALPPRPPSRASPEASPDLSPDLSRDIPPQSRERSDSEELERDVIRSIFEAIKELSLESGGDAGPALPLLDRLREIALESTDRALSPEERYEKYSPAIYKELEDYARTSISDEKERNSFLSILKLAKNIGKSQSYNPNNFDKKAYLSFVENLFDEANAPFPSGNWGADPEKQERDKQNFLALLDSVLDDIRM